MDSTQSAAAELHPERLWVGWSVKVGKCTKQNAEFVVYTGFKKIYWYDRYERFIESEKWTQVEW